MEIIIGLIVLAAVAYFLFFRKKDEPVEVVAPYKVEAVKVEDAPVATVDAPVVAEVVAEAEVAPAKKPRKPRAPKAETPAKPAAKKAPAKAKATKTVAKKPAARTVKSKKV